MQYDLKEFDPDIFIKWFTEEAQNGRMPPERLNEPSWGVSPQFLINASFDAGTADRVKWMYPLLFLAGVGIGMLGASVMTLLG